MHREREREWKTNAERERSMFTVCLSISWYCRISHNIHSHTHTHTCIRISIHVPLLSSLQRAFILRSFSISVSLLLLLALPFNGEFWQWIVYGADSIQKTHMLLCVARVMVVCLTHVNSQIFIRKTNAVSFCWYVYSLTRTFLCRCNISPVAWAGEFALIHWHCTMLAYRHHRHRCYDCCCCCCCYGCCYWSMYRVSQHCCTVYISSITRSSA